MSAQGEVLKVPRALAHNKVRRARPAVGDWNPFEVPCGVSAFAYGPDYGASERGCLAQTHGLLLEPFVMTVTLSFIFTVR